MIFCGTKEDVAGLYADTFQDKDNPLTAELIEEMELTDIEMQFESIQDRRFAVIHCECRICGHIHVAIVPVVVDLDNLECSNCGNMSMQEKGINAD